MKESSTANGTRRGEEQWRSLIARQQTSRLGVKAFCRSERISEASFYRWRALLKGSLGRQSGMEQDTGSAFVDLGGLATITATKPSLDLRLELGDGLVLHLVRC